MSAAKIILEVVAALDRIVGLAFFRYQSLVQLKRSRLVKAGQVEAEVSETVVTERTQRSAVI